ncbi:MAG TPA: nuclear transport factor 2 family protein [bacterium]|nr:nuclear transport factor 2 family protein [bacterium]HQL63695.1 nuclear transport factor 2 family protein [bacterium]
MYRSVNTAGIIAIVLLVMLGCATSKAKGPTPQEQITAAMQEFKAAWEARDVDRILACYAPDYRYSDGSDLTELQQFAEQAKEMSDLHIEVPLDDMQITMEENIGLVRIRSRLSSPDRKGQFLLDHRLRESDGKWLIFWSHAEEAD